jgi:hypothetical protein
MYLVTRNTNFCCKLDYEKLYHNKSIIEWNWLNRVKLGFTSFVLS